MSRRILLIATVFSLFLIAPVIGSSPVSIPFNPEINEIQKELNHRLHTLADLKEELHELRLKAGDIDEGELVAKTGQIPDTAALHTELSQLESNIDNLLKDGFEKTHPRIVALRAEIARKKQQVIELETEEALRKSLPQIIKQQQDLVDTLFIHLQQATDNAAAGKQTSSPVPSSH